MLTWTNGTETGGNEELSQMTCNFNRMLCGTKNQEGTNPRHQAREVHASFVRMPNLIGFLFQTDIVTFNVLSVSISFHPLRKGLDIDACLTGTFSEHSTEIKARRWATCRNVVLPFTVAHWNRAFQSKQGHVPWFNGAAIRCIVFQANSKAAVHF
jgi:hypothetical protein